MRRLAVLAAFVCAIPLTTDAQPAPAKVYRIGVLEAVDAASNAVNLGALRDGLRELGYVEGQNLTIVYRSTDGRGERYPDLAAELVRLGVDVIVTRGDQGALSARHATKTIPIVMASAGDPVASGLVASLARPRGNVTGFHLMTPPDLGVQRLHLLRELVPTLAHVGVLWHSGDIYAAEVMRDTEAVARSLGLTITSLPFQRPWEIDKLFETALLARIDALLTIPDSVTFAERARITQFASMARLPAMYGLREFVDAGGLVAYGVDRRELFRRCAGYVDRLLKGARPADLPIEAATKFELVINLKLASTLGLTVPPSLLMRAGDVIR